MVKSKVMTVGMIGLGGMAAAHRKAMEKIEGLQLGALCDVDEEILKMKKIKDQHSKLFKYLIDMKSSSCRILQI